jgi:hypothetical protein
MDFLLVIVPLVLRIYGLYYINIVLKNSNYSFPKHDSEISTLRTLVRSCKKWEPRSVNSEVKCKVDVFSCRA